MSDIDEIERAFDEWSDTWDDSATWSGPKFWIVWQAAWGAAKERIRELEAARDKYIDLADSQTAKLAAEREVSDKLATLLTDALDSFADYVEGGEADEWVVLSRTALAEVAAIRANPTDL